MRRPLVLLPVAVLVAVGVIGGWLWANRSHGERVLAIGDSLMVQAGPAVTQELSAQGYDVQVHAVPGSGLLDTNDDWAQTASNLIAGFNPDIVIAEFIGDYGLFGERPGIPPDSAQFFSSWQFAAQRLEDILTAQHAQVYWVVGPPVAQPSGELRLSRLDHIYQTLRAPDTGTGHPPTIDLNPAFTAGRAGYTQFLPGPDGTPVQIRQPDGTHLTPAGGLLFGRVVAQDVKPVSPLRRVLH